MWWSKVEKLLQHPLIEFRVDHKFSGVRRAHATMRERHHLQTTFTVNIMNVHESYDTYDYLFLC